jgi:ubiquinone/menaquinone biosynthesis C-methylase UbiE
MVETSSRKTAGVDRVRFVRASASRLPFPAGDFDLVVSTSSFRHWDDQPKGLREVARALAPGGTHILADGYKGRWRRPRLGLLPKRPTSTIPTLPASRRPEEDDGVGWPRGGRAEAARVPRPGRSW